jgi:hypothetical protein
MIHRVEIENPTNACISIKTNQGKILIDTQNALTYV